MNERQRENYRKNLIGLAPSHIDNTIKEDSSNTKEVVLPMAEEYIDPTYFREKAFFNWYTEKYGSSPTLSFNDYLTSSTISDEDINSIEEEARRLSIKEEALYTSTPVHEDISSINTPEDSTIFSSSSSPEESTQKSKSILTKKLLKKSLFFIGKKVRSTTRSASNRLNYIAKKGTPKLVKNLSKGIPSSASAVVTRDSTLFLAPQFKPIPSNLHSRTSISTPAGRAEVPTLQNIPAAKLMGQGSKTAGNLLRPTSNPASKALVPSLKTSPAGRAMGSSSMPSTVIDTSGLTRGGPLPQIGRSYLVPSRPTSVPTMQTQFSRPTTFTTITEEVDTRIPYLTESTKKKKKVKIKNTYNSQMSAVRRKM